jgi:hypothetical protein
MKLTGKEQDEISMDMRTALGVALMIHALVSFQLFEKVAVSSRHFADRPLRYAFNEVNPGRGYGFSAGIIAASSVSYLDSYRCNATNHQLRVTIPVWADAAYGVSLSYAHKCWKPREAPRRMIAPTFVVQQGDVVFDTFPAIQVLRTIGFTALSREYTL